MSIKARQIVRSIAILSSLVICALCTEVGAQSPTLDSIRRVLPSTVDFFEGEILRDTTLLKDDRRGYTLIQHLKSHREVPSISSLSRLVSILNLPGVVRRQGEYIDLSFRVKPLQYLDTGASLPAWKQLIETLAIEESIANSILSYTQAKGFDNALYTEARLLQSGRERLQTSNIALGTGDELTNKIKRQQIADYADQFSVAEIERKYWIPHFESSTQFSQNYISDNWHKGGISNLNLQTRNYFSLLYNREKIRWLNELENKIGFYYTGDEQAGKAYRINDDLLRLRSNYGIKISKHWSYTLDAELRTQLFSIYNNAHTALLSAPLAPIRTNIGIGLQYNYSSRSKTRYGRKFNLAVNLAPLSHNWRWSHRSDIALARHGLKKDKLSLHTFGSTLKAEMQWDINMDITWTSRLYINTSYQNIETEWENTLVMRINKYFSTRLNVQLRYDDRAEPSPKWNKHLQITEILSFGFNYKI